MSDGIEIGTYLGENKYVEIVCKKEEAIFEIENKKMILTREDLITAFELGINNIEEVIILKHKISDSKKFTNNLIGTEKSQNVLCFLSLLNIIIS